MDSFNTFDTVFVQKKIRNERPGEDFGNRSAGARIRTVRERQEDLRASTSLDRRVENRVSADERNREEMRAAGPDNGRVWIRGFYRNTPRGGRFWVPGFFRERGDR